MSPIGGPQTRLVRSLRGCPAIVELEVFVTAVEPHVSAQTPETGRARARDVVGAYVGLMKPRVIELLLLTTVPVMFFAARGVPPLGLVVATVIGGQAKHVVGYMKDFLFQPEQARTPEAAYAYSTSYSLNAEEIMALVVPEFVGDNAQSETKAGDRYWGKNAFKTNADYAGLLGVLLLPLLFIRVRTPGQIPDLVRRLGPAVRLLSGFVLPKFTEERGIPFLEAVRSSGLKLVCVHKGLPLPPMGDQIQFSRSDDVGRAAFRTGPRCRERGPRRRSDSPRKTRGGAGGGAEAARRPGVPAPARHLECAHVQGPPVPHPPLSGPSVGPGGRARGAPGDSGEPFRPRGGGARPPRDGARRAFSGLMRSEPPGLLRIASLPAPPSTVTVYVPLSAASHDPPGARKR